MRGAFAAQNERETLTEQGLVGKSDVVLHRMLPATSGVAYVKEVHMADDRRPVTIEYCTS